MDLKVGYRHVEWTYPKDCTWRCANVITRSPAGVSINVMAPHPRASYELSEALFVDGTVVKVCLRGFTKDNKVTAVHEEVVVCDTISLIMNYWKTMPTDRAWVAFTGYDADTKAVSAAELKQHSLLPPLIDIVSEYIAS